MLCVKCGGQYEPDTAPCETCGLTTATQYMMDLFREFANEDPQMWTQVIGQHIHMMPWGSGTISSVDVSASNRIWSFSVRFTDETIPLKPTSILDKRNFKG